MLADTHALVWYLTDPGQLSPRAHELFADADRGRTVTIASVTLVELVYIAEKRRDSIDPEVVRDVLETLESRVSPITVAPISPEIVRRLMTIDRVRVRIRSTAPSLLRPRRSGRRC